VSEDTHNPGDAAGNQNVVANELQFDLDMAVAHLLHHHPVGPWQLTAIPAFPGGKKKVKTLSFSTPDGVCAFIRQYNNKTAQYGIYFPPNPLRTAMDKKAKKEDVATITILHVDADPRKLTPDEEATWTLEKKREHQIAERTRLLAMLQNFPIKPSCIWDSGGGYQASFRLEKPQQVDGDIAKIEDIECYTRWLEKEFGSDNTHNADRILRLAGTINWPKQEKIDQGRQPALSTIISMDPELAYDLSAFQKAPPKAEAQAKRSKAGAAAHTDPITVVLSEQLVRTEPEEIDNLPVPDWVKNIIRTGIHPTKKKPSRSESLFSAVREMVKCKVPDDVIYGLQLDPRHGIASSVVGRSDRERYAKRQIRRAKLFLSEPEVAWLNEKYAWVYHGNKSAILDESPDVDGKPGLQFRNIEAFKQWLAKYPPIVRGKSITPLANYWLNHTERRDYRGLAFRPLQDTGEYLNLWRGFSVDPRAPQSDDTDEHGNPKPGRAGCGKFLQHLRDNVCGGIDSRYNYLVGWMAKIVQDPGGEKSGTSIVLLGETGCGKTIVAKWFGALLGEHYLKVSRAQHLTGQFNGHLARVVLLHADEAIWAGDKEAEGVLRDLISSDKNAIEFKGKDLIYVENYVNLMVTSEQEWAVPVTLRERRHAVFKVLPTKAKDRAYFGALEDDMLNGGLEALLHFLQTFDYKNIDLGVIPETEGLWDQKVRSMSVENHWLLGVLMAGRLPSDEHGTGFSPTEFLYDDYIREAKKIGERRRKSKVEFGIWLSKVLKSKVTKKIGVYFPIITAIGQRAQKKGNAYQFASLKECRTQFEELVKTKIDWAEQEQGELSVTAAEPTWEPSPVVPKYDEATSED
jgi:hypothetical protein